MSRTAQAMGETKATLTPAKLRTGAAWRSTPARQRARAACQEYIHDSDGGLKFLAQPVPQCLVVFILFAPEHHLLCVRTVRQRVGPFISHMPSPRLGSR